MAGALFLGLDVGTSGVKAILLAPDGEVVASALAPLTMSTPHPGWAEQDPDAWWDAAVAGIGISGQMHSSVFLDRAGQVIRPALLWCDGRTTEQCAEITRRAGGEERLREWVRNPALEGFTLPRGLPAG